MSLGYLPWYQPVADADRPCLRDDNEELTYAQVTERVSAFAGQLAEHGVGRGDVVAIMLPNRVELLIGLLAAWRLGAVATPINPVFTASEATYQIEDSGAVLVLTGRPRRSGRRPSGDPRRRNATDSGRDRAAGSGRST